jgi:hypothetical protein
MGLAAALKSLVLRLLNGCRFSVTPFPDIVCLVSSSLAEMRIEIELVFAEV